MKAILAFTITLFTCFSLTAQTVNLGILTDFEPNQEIADFIQELEYEIQRILGPSRDLKIEAEHVLHNNRSISLAQQNFEQLENQVDLILLGGPISIKGALNSGVFRVPTIAMGILDPELQDIPYTEFGSSGVENFSYVWAYRDIGVEMQQFYEIHPFNHLTVLIEEGYQPTFNPNVGDKKIDSMQQHMGVTFDVIALNDQLDLDSAALHPETDAIFVALPSLRPTTNIRKLANLLIERKLPSFSGNKLHVDNGILLSVSYDNGRNHMIRKVAVMVDEALDGRPLENMQVSIDTRVEPFLNISTAQQIGFSPKFEYLFTANIISDSTESVKRYSLEEVMEIAIDKNLDIQISYRDIDLAFQDYRQARSQYYPTADLSATALQINPSSASSAIGQPERKITGTGSLSQVIYSEEVIAGIKIQQFLRNAQDYATQQAILDVMLDSYTGYFNVLLTQSNVAILQENLEVSKQNLELAKIRVNLGSATNADVYRWESEVANAKQAVIEAQTNLLATKLQLNNLLANELDEDYEIKDVALNGPLYQQIVENELSQYVQNPEELRLVTEFLVEEAILNHPAEGQLQANINVVERQQKLYKRLFYLPTVGLQGQVNDIWYRGGEGSELPDQGVPGFNIVDLTWNVGVTVSYPLFQGTRRSINLQTAKIQREQIGLEKERLDLNLALGVRSNSLRLLSAWTNTSFSKTSSENSVKNFEMVQENYREGQVSITTLIDAQQAALQAKFNYAISIYEYLLSYLELEYAVGFFSAFASQEDVDAFRARFERFLLENPD